MLQNLVIYLLLGVAFASLWWSVVQDIAPDSFKENLKIMLTLVVIIWPIAMVLFLWGMATGQNKSFKE